MTSIKQYFLRITAFFCSVLVRNWAISFSNSHERQAQAINNYYTVRDIPKFNDRANWSRDTFVFINKQIKTSPQ